MNGPPLHLVLVEPQIPPNTGNVARLCAATGCVLHLVDPLGFSIDDRALKRAGLDYWPAVSLVRHASLERFLDAFDGPLWLLSTRAQRAYAEARSRAVTRSSSARKRPACRNRCSTRIRAERYGFRCAKAPCAV